MTEPSSRVRLTAGRIADFTCPSGKSQAFLWDTEAPTLALRVTPTGRKTYVFESRLHGATVRISIGDVKSWPLDAPASDKGAKSARREAARLAQMVDSGIDPREVAREQQAQKAAMAAATAEQAVLVGDAWARYLAEGKPLRKDAWKPRYLADLRAMAAPGGEPKKRGEGVTRPGPLYPLLSMRLCDVDEDALKRWFDEEAQRGRHQATRALRMFQGFLRWCSARPEYRKLADREATKAPAILESLPRNKRRTDALEASQVAGWWTAVEQLHNRTASVYLRALLLTGARREEMAALTWSQVDFQWRRVTLADKVEDSRVIPLTPYLAQQLARLPRVGPFVFASSGKAGRLTDTRASHAQALKNAGIDHLTIHGLRRSFSLLGEAAGAPAGAIAQLMGHKPSATAEGYRPRSMDALRPFAQQIERYILGLAGVQFVEEAAPGKLRVVPAAAG